MATRDIPAGSVVQRFMGQVVYRNDIPEDEIRYAYLMDDHNWMIPETDARFANHSCDPNCDINSSDEIITLKAVKKGEELTISYNIIAEECSDLSLWDSRWDPRWNFVCLCGSKHCQGLIDKYVKENGEPLF